MEADPVISALQAQVDCYRRLAKLAEVQHEHVQQGRTEELLQLLAMRQEALDRIVLLEKEVAPAKKRWSEYFAPLGATHRASADAMLAEVRLLLEQITTADRNDALVLQQRKLSLGKQINQASSARQVNRNYAAAAYGRPRSSMDVQS